MFYPESKGSKGGRIPTDATVVATEKTEKSTTVVPKAPPRRLGTTRGRERPPEFLERPLPTHLARRGRARSSEGGALMHFRLRRPAVRVAVVAPRPERLELTVSSEPRFSRRAEARSRGRRGSGDEMLGSRRGPPGTPAHRRCGEEPCRPCPARGVEAGALLPGKPFAPRGS